MLYLKDIHGSFEFYDSLNSIPSYISISDVLVYSEKKSEILDSNYTFLNILSDYNLEILENELFLSQSNLDLHPALKGEDS